MEDVIVVSVIVSVISFSWFLIYTALNHYGISDIRDFVMIIFIYFFINFYITFISILFSGKQLTELRLMLIFSSMIIWVAIMFDFYFHSMKGEF
jgi:hypothetical protein